MSTIEEQRERKFEEVTKLLEKPDPALDRPKAAHIIKTEPGQSATAKILEARVNGTAVEAICGVVFVPQQDPSKLPVCEQCKALYEVERAFYENLNNEVGQ